MHSRHASRLRTALVALLSSLGACIPLPIANTTTLSAPVSGIVATSEGTPIDSITVSVSHDVYDGRCSNTAASTVSNGSGTFAIDQIDEHHGWLWVGPYDIVPPPYLLCIGDGEAKEGYVGVGGLSGDQLPPDSVSCVEWLWETETRFACSGQAEQRYLVGGEWRDRVASGVYRVITTTEAREVSGYDRPMPRPQVYVQWLVGSAVPYRVAGVAKVRMPDRDVKDLREPRIRLIDGEWVASFAGWIPKWHNSSASGELDIRLGVPGDSLAAEVR